MINKALKSSSYCTTHTPAAALLFGFFSLSACDVTLPAEGKAIVKTDIAVALPEGCYGRVGTCLTAACQTVIITMAMLV